MEGNKKDYEMLYQGAHRGDSWTLPENFDENPRMRAVLEVRNKFAGPVSVLDIGCGKGFNTKWITNNNDESLWTGVDIVSREKLGIVTSGSSQKFFEGDIQSEEFRKQTGIEYSKFDIIVDQGASFVEMDDLVEVEQYLKLVHKLLSDRGFFLVLTIIGEPQTVVFADGRKRVIRALDDFQKELFSKYFYVDDNSKGYSSFFTEYSYSTEFVTSDGSNINLQIVQMLLRKKNTL